MQFVTIEECRAQLKTDEYQDADVEAAATRAEAACVAFCNREIFVDASALASALLAMPTTAQGQYNSYTAALAAAEDITDEITKSMTIAVATDTYRRALNDQNRTRVAKVAGDDFKAAVLLTLGHLWRNREDVAAGQGATAVELPMNSKWYLAPYFYAGGN